MAALKTLLPDVEDAGIRAGVWNNLRSAFHDAAISPADVIDIAEASLPVEDLEDTINRTMAWLLGRVVPAAPAGSAERLHRAALAKLAAMPVGSELQLSSFRFAVSSASDPEVLRGWLAAPPEGIDLDLDLRWRLLVQLAALGATDRAELQAALDAQPTGRSRVEHMRAVVSLPDAEAKALAWDVFTGRLDVPNYELEAAALGMWRVGQESLTDPYVDRYFTDLPGTAGGPQRLGAG